MTYREHKIRIYNADRDVEKLQRYAAAIEGDTELDDESRHDLLFLVNKIVDQELEEFEANVRNS